MKHPIEKNLEFIKLSQFFKKMEAMAETMEIDGDGSDEDALNKASPEYTLLKKNILSIAHKRSETFENRHQSEDKEEVIMELTFNEYK